jgi:putative Mg2+ transporter-C (MgtC) family protein
MDPAFNWPLDLLLLERVALAISLGSAIGLERRLRHHAAGLHTNALVAGGAAIFCLLATLLSDTSATRVAGQVAVGIGFVCAGVIFRHGSAIHGINTASTVWCSAACGVLAGSGFLLLATGCAALVLGSNVVLHVVEHRWFSGP